MKSRLMFVGMLVVFVLAVTPAGATVICGPPVDLGGGSVQITIYTSPDVLFTSVSAPTITGTVSNPQTTSNHLPETVCGTEDSTCTFSLVGSGAQPHEWTRTFNDTSDPSTAVTCTVTDADGLPVELVEFTVE